MPIKNFRRKARKEFRLYRKHARFFLQALLYEEYYSRIAEEQKK